MHQQESPEKTRMSASAIWFAALIGIGFCLVLGALVGGLSSSISFKDNVPADSVLFFIGLGAVILLSSAFFIAGFIASKISHQQFVFDAVIHSLSTWAIMALLLVSMVVVATLSESLRNTFSKLEAPAIITDVQVFKAKAVTTIKGSDDKGESAKPTPEDKNADKMLTLLWWIAFSSLVVGSFASVGGGLLGRKRLLE